MYQIRYEKFIQVIGICVVIWTSLGVVLNQNTPEPPFKSIYYAASAPYLMWLPDGSGLKIYDYDVEEWYLYLLSDQTVIPYNPSTSERILARLQDVNLVSLAVHPLDQTPSLVYLSPNGHFAAYAADIGNPNTYVFAITDLVTDQQKLVEIIKLADVFSAKLFEVRWNLDGSALIVKLGYDIGQVHYYIRHIREDLDDIEVISLTSEESNFYFGEVYDIDSTGRFIIGHGSVISEKIGGLLLFDTEELSAIEIASSEDWINTAIFEKPDDLKITYVTKNGLFEYDRLTGISRLLTSEINSANTAQVALSPDGRYAAILYMSDNGNVVLREIDPS